MENSSPSGRGRRPIRLIPGVIYEWTPNDTPSVVHEWTSRETLRFAPLNPPPAAEPPPTPALPILEPGAAIIPGYQLVEPIGEGCTGEVWRAIAPDNVAVALKFIAGTRRGAEQEVQAVTLMQGVRHPDLLTIFGIWQSESWAVIGMDLADESLLDRFEAAVAAGRVGLDFAELTALFQQAARGIDFMNEPIHSLGGRESVSLIHRDIKPQNLLIHGDGLKIGDFGLLQQLDPELAFSETVVSDWLESLVTAYSSPEVCQGGISRHSDQYSLAASYCHLRGGRAPNPVAAASSPARRPSDKSVAGHDAIDLTMLSPPERPVVARALATDPAERWPSCSAFVAALVASARLPTTPSPSSASYVRQALGPRIRTRPRRLAALAAVAALVAAAITMFSLVPSRQATPTPTPAALATRPESAPVDPNPTPAAVSTDALVATSLIKPEVPEPPVVPVVPPPLTVATVAPLVPSPAVVASPSIPVGAGELPPALVAAAAQPLVGPPGEDMPAATVAPIASAEIRAALTAWTSSLRDRLQPWLTTRRDAVRSWYAALPRPTPPPQMVAKPAEPPRPRTASIIVRMPSSKAELVVRGAVGRGNPDEWYGPRRVIHSPPLDSRQDYLVGAFWTDASGRPATRSLALKVEPGRLYEVDLRAEEPVSAEVPRLPEP